MVFLLLAHLVILWLKEKVNIQLYLNTFYSILTNKPYFLDSDFIVGPAPCFGSVAYARVTSWNSSPPFGHHSGNCCNSLISYPFPGYPPRISNPNMISAEEHVVFADLTTKDLEKFDADMKAYQRKKLDKEILDLHASGKISGIYVCNASPSASNANVDDTSVGAAIKLN